MRDESIEPHARKLSEAITDAIEEFMNETGMDVLMRARREWTSYGDGVEVADGVYIQIKPIAQRRRND